MCRYKLLSVICVKLLHEYVVYTTLKNNVVIIKIL